MTILASISALCCLVLFFFWARSYSRYEGIVRYGRGGLHTYTILEAGQQRSDVAAPGRTSGLVSARGSLTLASIVDPRIEEWSWFGWSHPIGQELQPNVMALMHPTIPAQGVSIGSGNATGLKIGNEQLELPYWRISVPYIILVVLTAILPVRWVLNYRLIARREREGRCTDCGHDLHGLKTGKCPACGAPIE